jgi:hypothetical protein
MYSLVSLGMQLFSFLFIYGPSSWVLDKILNHADPFVRINISTFRDRLNTMHIRPSIDSRVCQVREHWNPGSTCQGCGAT